MKFVSKVGLPANVPGMRPRHLSLVGEFSHWPPPTLMGQSYAERDAVVFRGRSPNRLVEYWDVETRLWRRHPQIGVWDLGVTFITEPEAEELMWDLEPEFEWIPDDTGNRRRRGTRARRV